MTLTKQQAIGIFGSGAETGRALGITRSAVSQWPDVLDQRMTDLVVGAAVRLGKQLPEGSAGGVPLDVAPPDTQAEPAAA